ncbi:MULTISPECIES: hypothetical protein [Catenuloplanes]|uniref:GH26 domain-containing protein n=1 Tax=Catenuloplanes niger TaxID=587534 RepID=A0AAE3ZN43_9ACTN|nr:hypothetical protein [Catenuloplanes niger]MDR7321801.1 hypothetical protein [Catenuloplanes niger]
MNRRGWVESAAAVLVAAGLGVQASPAAAAVTRIEDTAQGTGIDQVVFSSGWSDCAGNCATAADGSFKWTSTPGSTAVVRFSGDSVRLFGMKEPWGYVASVSVDGGTPVDVDYYAPAVSTSTVEVYAAAGLGAGDHTLVLTLTNRKNPASAGGRSIGFDRVETGTPAGTSERASGLPWSSGVNPQEQSTARADQFAAFRGAPVDNVVLFPPRDNWTTLSNPQWIADGLPTGFDAARDDLVMTVPLWPGSNSVGSTGTQAQWRNLADVIETKDPNAYVRLGWEMNLPASYWALTDANRATWQASFVQAVQWMKAAAPGLRIVWNPNKGGDQTCNNCSRAVFQAVKSLVDVYGIDSYDSWPPATNAANRAVHLNDLLGESLAYAKANGKPFAVPEWGVACNTGGCQWAGNAGGDNPLYIRDYLGFFNAHAADLAFESYFDEPAAYIRSALSTSPIGPNAPAAYRADIQAYRA